MIRNIVEAGLMDLQSLKWRVRIKCGSVTFPLSALVMPTHANIKVLSEQKTIAVPDYYQQQWIIHTPHQSPKRHLRYGSDREGTMKFPLSS